MTAVAVKTLSPKNQTPLDCLAQYSMALEKAKRHWVGKFKSEEDFNKSPFKHIFIISNDEMSSIKKMPWLHFFDEVTQMWVMAFFAEPHADDSFLFDHYHLAFE